MQLLEPKHCSTCHRSMVCLCCLIGDVVRGQLFFFLDLLSKFFLLFRFTLVMLLFSFLLLTSEVAEHEHKLMEENRRFQDFTRLHWEIKICWAKKEPIPYGEDAMQLVWKTQQQYFFFLGGVVSLFVPVMLCDMISSFVEIKFTSDHKI